MIAYAFDRDYRRPDGASNGCTGLVWARAREVNNATVKAQSNAFA